MKKIWTLILVIGLLVCAISTARADLIGVKGSLGYPDISFDNSGVATYVANTDIFTIVAQDLKIVMSNGGAEYWLSGQNLNTAFSLSITVNNSGELAARTGTMTERVTEGTVTIAGHEYGAGTILLSGSVIGFGWGEGVLLGQFDFLLNNLSGKLVDDGIWPTTYATGIYSVAEILNGWTGSWDNDFHLGKVKGDKAPIPEPATMLLLGSGLIGLAGFARRRFKK